MSRNRTAAATVAPALDENDIDAYLDEASPEPQIEDTIVESSPPAQPFANSREAFVQIKGLIAASPRRAQASALFNGRYRSGVFSPEGREALYPYLGARKIYPQENLSVNQKLAHVESMLPSSDPRIDLLVVDLARLAVAAGVELPPAFEPDTLKASLLNGGSTATTGNGDDFS